MRAGVKACLSVGRTAMFYKDYRDNIKSGDVLAWTHKGWNSFYNFQVQMVRTFTQSEYSHVGVAYVLGTRLLLIEAVVPRVQLFPLSLCESFYHISMDKPFTQEAEDFALNQIGEPYSKWMAIKAFFGGVTKGDSGIWMCSKLCNEILRVNGFDYGENFTPSTLVQAALEDGKKLTYVKNEPKR